MERPTSTTGRASKSSCSEVSDDAHPEAHPGVDPPDLRVAGEVAETVDRNLIGRRVGDAAVVVAPVADEVISGRLRCDRIGVLDDVSAHVVRAPGTRRL